jgi:hypothetical protein
MEKPYTENFGINRSEAYRMMPLSTHLFFNGQYLSGAQFCTLFFSSLCAVEKKINA